MKKMETLDSNKKAAKIAGFVFIFAFIVPTLNWAFVLSKFNVAKDALATADNIMANEFLFRVGITVELFLSVALIILALVLYKILKSVNKELAMFALSLKLVEATLMAVSVLIPFIALQALNEEAYRTALPLEQLQFPIGLIFNSHTAITSIAMVFLGMDMMVFSYLFLKSKFIPGSIAGIGIFSFALIFIHAMLSIVAPQYATMPISQIIFWAPSGLWELLIGSWLLVKGLKVREQE